jgi:hypothetical protein
MTVFERGVVQENIESPQPVFLFNNSAASAVPDVVKSSFGVLYFIVLDNSLNLDPCYLQIWDLAVGSVTVGSTPADEIIQAPGGILMSVPKMVMDSTRTTITLVGVYDYIPVPGSSITTVSYFTGANPGKVFSTAITVAVTTSLVGAISPASPVSVTICYQ